MGSQKSKRILAVVFLLVAVVMIAVLTYAAIGLFSGSSKTAAPPAAPATSTAVAGDPHQGVLTATGYHRIYSVTFYYSGQQIAVQQVQVSRLNKKVSLVHYQVDIVPAGGDASWINNTNFHLVNTNHNIVARSIKVQTYGSHKKTTVLFVVPTAFIKASACRTDVSACEFFEVDYPTSVGSTFGSDVRLALDINPASELLR